MFNIIEKFISIDGEGYTQGELSTFIRFCKCNLKCSWCDTKYSFYESEIKEVLSAEEIYKYIKENNTVNVTLTGGEPLIQKDIVDLLLLLDRDKDLKTSIETNGSICIKEFKDNIISNNISFVLDFKLQSSNMTKKMDLNNFNYVTMNDVYKFVIADEKDLLYAYEIIKKYDLCNKCRVIFSPVFGSIKLEKIVDFMKNNNLNKVKLQIQLHKIIWGNKKCV